MIKTNKIMWCVNSYKQYLNFRIAIKCNLKKNLPLQSWTQENLFYSQPIEVCVTLKRPLIALANDV